MTSFSPFDPDSQAAAIATSQAAAIATAGRASEERENALVIIEQAMKGEKLKRLHELASKDDATPEEIQETAEILNLFYKIYLHGDHVYEDMGNKSASARRLSQRYAGVLVAPPRKIGDKIQIEAFTDNETMAKLQAVILNILPPRRKGEWMFRVEYTIPAGVVNKVIYESEIIDEVNE
jgi:hypothetical protein